MLLIWWYGWSWGYLFWWYFIRRKTIQKYFNSWHLIQNFMGEKLLRIFFDKIDGFIKTDNGIIDI